MHWEIKGKKEGGKNTTKDIHWKQNSFLKPYPHPHQILNFMIKSNIVTSKCARNHGYLLFVGSMVTSGISAIIVDKQERDPIQ